MNNPGPWRREGDNIVDARDEVVIYVASTAPGQPVAGQVGFARFDSEELVLAAPAMLALLRAYAAVDTEAQARAWWAAKELLLARIDR